MTFTSKNISRTFRILTLILSLAIVTPSCAQKKNTIAETPPMGWNSWNWFGKHDINEKLIKQIIDAMVKNGLRDLGYDYVVIDGGWRDTKLGPNGELLPHPVKFPNGIKPLADYAHAKGMKLGVHVVPGTHDCGGDLVGAKGHEKVHLQQFVDWGLDFIKLDQCRFENDPCQECPKTKLGWSEPNSESTYKEWSELLRNSGRDILFSISAYEFRDWYPQHCDMARTTLDIQTRIHKGGAHFNPPSDLKMVHKSIMAIAELNNEAAEAAGNGYWNDPDMLATGVHGLSLDEQVSHFGLWCIMSSPLMLGNDPRKMNPFEEKLITNKEMIAVNQDPTEQGKKIKDEGNAQVWVKNLQGGKKAVLFLNMDKDCKQDVSISLNELGFKSDVNVRDVVDQKDLGARGGTLSFSLRTHASKLVVVSK